MKKFVVLLTKEKGKMAMNYSENDDSDILQALYIVYKKLGQFFYHTCVNMFKDTSVLLYLNKFISIRTVVLAFVKLLCACAQPL